MKGRTLFTFLAALFLLVGTCGAEEIGSESDFWMECSQEFGRANWRVFRPKSESLNGLGFLIKTELEHPFGDLKPSRVLGELYKEIGQLKVMGQKRTTFADKEAVVLSFRGQLDSQPLAGRALIFPSGTGSGVLLLLRHQKSDERLPAAFDRLHQQGLDSLPAESRE